MMEKHFWYGVALLVVLLAFCIAVHSMTDAMLLPAAQILERASQAAQQGKLTQAHALTRQAQQQWQRFRNISAALCDHAPIQEADCLFAQLSLCGSEVELTACCTQLSQVIQTLVQTHGAAWWNLL